MIAQIALATALYVVPAFYQLYATTCRYFFAFGGRGGAKSIAFADYIIVEASRRRVRILCTREVQKSIKESVHALIKERILVQGREKEFKITDNGITHKKTKSEIIFAGLRDHTADSIKSYTNISICWVEEAHSVTKKSWDILRPTIRANGSRILFSYNRFMENDPCHSLGMSHVDTKVRKEIDENGKTYHWYEFSGKDAVGIFINGESGNPKFPEVLRKDMEADFLNDPEVARHVWLGEPIGEEEFACLDRKLVQDACERKIENYSKGTDARYVMGVDVARMGLDRTVFYLTQKLDRDKYRYVNCKTYQKQDLVKSADKMEELLKKHKIKKYQVTLNIDDTGVGGGLVDIMKSRGYKVIAINFGNKPVDTKKYDTIASEMWFRMREVLETSSLPDQEYLRAELTGRQWKMDNKERRCIEKKDVFKKRYGKSPDLADACVLAHYNRKDAKKHTQAIWMNNLTGYSNG